MPSVQEIQQPSPAAQMAQAPATEDLTRISSEQPRPVEQMSTEEPMKMRGGGEGGDICCGLCAACACFECLECCC